MALGDIYNIIVAPISTEKSAKALETGNKYSFKVSNKATKEDVKKAIETIFEVEVENVNIVNTMGKTKRFKGKLGKKSDVKKAIVSVKKGQEINFTKLG